MHTRCGSACLSKASEELRCLGRNVYVRAMSGEHCKLVSTRNLTCESTERSLPQCPSIVCAHAHSAGKAFQLVHRFASRVHASTSEGRYEEAEAFAF